MASASTASAMTMSRRTASFHRAAAAVAVRGIVRASALMPQPLPALRGDARLLLLVVGAVRLAVGLLRRNGGRPVMIRFPLVPRRPVGPRPFHAAVLRPTRRRLISRLLVLRSLAAPGGFRPPPTTTRIRLCWRGRRTPRGRAVGSLRDRVFSSGAIVARRWSSAPSSSPARPRSRLPRMLCLWHWLP